MGVVEWILLILLSIFWGLSFFFNEIAIRGFSPLTVVALRLIISAVTIHFILYFSNLSFPKGIKIWSYFAVMGFFNNIIPFFLIAWGQLHISSSLAAIIVAIVPIFTVVLAHLVTQDEKIKFSSAIGILLGFLGVVVMIGIDALKGLTDDLLGQLAVLLASFSYACASVYGRKFGKLKVSSLVTATGQLTVSSLILLPFSLLIDRPWENFKLISLDVWLSIFGLALICSVMAYYIYFKILAKAGPTNISLVAFLIPISSIVLGINLLDEVLETKHILGMFMIAVGLFAIDGRVIHLFKKFKN